MNETSAYDSNYYDPTVDKILAVVYFMLAISVLVLNSLEAYLMVRLRKERSVSTVFTCSLTLTDISMGCMGIPFSAIAMSQQRRWIFKDVMCNISGFFINTCTFTSLFSICLITVNRYLAMIFPIKYQRLMTIRISQIAVGLVWAVACLRSSVPFFFGKGYSYYQTTLCSWSTAEVFGSQETLFYYLLFVVPFFLSFSATIFCSIHMVIALIRRSVTKRGAKGGKGGDKEKDAVITTFLIILAFIGCYFCYYFAIFGYLLDTFKSWPNKSFLILEIMMFLTIYMNSLFNPILYIYRNTRYKKELTLIKNEILSRLNIMKNGQESFVKIKRASAISQSMAIVNNNKRDTYVKNHGPADEQC